MKTKQALEFATHFEGAAIEASKVRRSRIADTVSNTLALIAPISMKASLIMESTGFPSWLFIAIALVPAWLLSDLIVTQMVSSELNGDKGAWMIAVISYIMSIASLLDVIFVKASSFEQIFTVQNITFFIIVFAMSGAPIVIIHYSVQAWRRKMHVEIEVDGKMELVYLPDYINKKVLSEAADLLVKEQMNSMTERSSKKLARIAMKQLKNDNKLKINKAA